MKKMPVLLMALLLGIYILTSHAWAASLFIVNEIPGRYLLMRITDVEPDAPIDKDSILKAAQEQLTQKGVQDLQYVLYDKGQAPGGGIIRAFGELTTDKNKSVAEYTEFTFDGNETEDEKKIRLERMMLAEKSLGYEITSKELWDAYSDNEVVADDDFKNKAIIMEIKVPGLSKDFKNQPYMFVPSDKYGISGGVRLYLSWNDPYLRSIKKGSEIVIRGLPQGMSMKDVVVNAEIVMVVK